VPSRRRIVATSRRINGAVAIGQRLQAGMGACAVKLIVEGAVLVQYAVEYVAAIRRAARPGTSEGTANLEGGMKQQCLERKGSGSCHWNEACLACEYAKCKNRHRQFRECDVHLYARPCAMRRIAMTDSPSSPAPTAERKKLTPAAERALAEAEASPQGRRGQRHAASEGVQGPKGPEPTRYGDWERKGIASDF
jgi:hypothetical protein